MLPFVYVLALLFVAVRFAPAESALYVADPAADAIYRVVPGRTPADAPEFVSGRTTVRAHRAAFLNSRELVFSAETSDLLVWFDLTSGALREIAASPAGMRLLALDAGPEEGTVSALYGAADGRVELWEGRRRGDDAWDFATTGLAVRRDPEVATHGAAVLGLGGGRFVVFVDGAVEDELVVLARETPRAPIAVQATLDHPVTLARFPGEAAWVAYPLDGAGTSATLYDHAGAAVRRLSLDWIEDQLGWARFADSESREAGSLADAVVVPPLPLPMDAAGSALRRVDLRWRLFHPLRGGIYWADEQGRLRTRECVLERGAGPGFEMIRDLVAAPDGTLYVLDGMLEPLRVVRVDPASGDRRVVALLPADRSYDLMRGEPDGALLLPRVERRQETVSENGAPVTRVIEYQVFDRLRLADDPSSAVLEVAFASQRVRRLLDFDVEEAGTPQVLLEVGEGVRVARVEADRLAPTPALQFMGGMMEFLEGTDEESPPTYRGTVLYPPDCSPARPQRLRVAIHALQRRPGLDGLHTIVVTAPDGRTRFEIPVQEPFHEWYVWEGTVGWRETVLVPIPESLVVTGAWTVEAQGMANPFLQLVAGIVPHPAPRARFLALDRDAAPWLYETHPPTLARWDTASGDLARVTLAPAEGEPLDADDLNRPSQLVLSPEGTTAWIGLFERPMVIELDRTTGAARVVMSRRPGQIDERLLDMSRTSHLRLAVGPLAPLADPGGWAFDAK
ncbi:MAG: hypothetical protein KF858_10405 [Candidatus Sumerlaeia bacterium]|nr:hypothetical protein [Candidatus Sumerlaeia bacterium]